MDSYLGIRSPPISCPSGIKRSLRSVSIVLRLDCLTIGFGAHPNQPIFDARTPADRSAEPLGADLHYVEEKGRILEPPRFSIWIERSESGVRFIDGNRGIEPRQRTS